MLGPIFPLGRGIKEIVMYLHVTRPGLAREGEELPSRTPPTRPGTLLANTPSWRDPAQGGQGLGGPARIRCALSGGNV